MSTHNICFRQEVRKIICGYPLLSVAMLPHILLDSPFLLIKVSLICLAFLRWSALLRWCLSRKGTEVALQDCQPLL